MPKKAKDDVNDQESPSSEGESLQPTEIKSEEKQENYRELLDQIKSEFNVGLKHVRQRWSENTSRLKLYNNQKRNKEHIGDPLLFSTFQTSFASLYDDEMQHEFE